MTLLVIFDTETGGTDPATDHIYQLGAVVHKQGDPVDGQHILEVNTYCDPGVPIPPESTAVHHITDDKVKGFPHPAEVMKEFIKEISAVAEGDAVVIGGHNSEFDFQFLSKYADIPESWRKICTMRLGRRYEPKARNHKLETLYREHYKLSSPRTAQAHDALCDVWMAFEMLLHLMKVHQKPWYAELAAELLNPKELEVMPFGGHQGKSMRELPKKYLRWLADQGDQMDPDVLFTAQRILRDGQ